MNPKTYKKLVANKLSRDFRSAVEIVEVDFPVPAPNQIVVRNMFAGVNASDVNISAGMYFTSKPPFDLGVEAAGEVVAIGSDVENFQVGDRVLTSMLGGGYREYFAVDANQAIAIPQATPEVLTIAVSGLTASLGLEVAGEMKSGEVVLVTAAAGGTGHYAVQLAKLAGNHVIGTCSSEAKAELLKKLGCDRVINYRSENLDAVLKKEYANKVNLVYECVGREIFDICVDNLAIRGRLIIVGFISEYTSGLESVNSPRIYDKLLWKSASIRGFLFSHYAEHIPRHLKKLMELFAGGKIHAAVDPTEFKGIESIVSAVEYLHSGKNCGKVIVRF